MEKQAELKHKQRISSPQPKIKPEQSESQPQQDVLNHLIHGRQGALGGGTLQNQVQLLADPNLTNHTPLIASKIDQVQGNLHLQRAINQVKSNPSPGTTISKKQSTSPHQTTDSTSTEGFGTNLFEEWFAMGGSLGFTPTPPPNGNGQPIQPKLAVNTPDDVYEQEADQVADTVMQMPDPVTTEMGVSSPVSRQPFGQVNSEVPVQRKGSDAPPVTPEVESNINSMQGSGNSLHDKDRAFFESRMGQDFSNVRIHTDDNAVKTSQVLQAKAFTVGNNIAFNAGEYQPGSDEGQHLLAHELTHVVQQGAAVQRSPMASPITPIASSQQPLTQVINRATKDEEKTTSPDTEDNLKTTPENTDTLPLTETLSASDEIPVPTSSLEEPQSLEEVSTDETVIKPELEVEIPTGEADTMIDEATGKAEENLAELEQQETDNRTQVEAELATLTEPDEDLPALPDLLEPPLEDSSQIVEEALVAQQANQTDIATDSGGELQASMSLGQFVDGVSVNESPASFEADRETVAAGESPSMDIMASVNAENEPIPVSGDSVGSDGSDASDNQGLSDTPSLESGANDLSSQEDVTIMRTPASKTGPNLVMREAEDDEDAFDWDKMGLTNAFALDENAMNMQPGLTEVEYGLDMPQDMATVESEFAGDADAMSVGELEGEQTEEDECKAEEARGIVQGIASSLETVPGTIEQTLQAEATTIKDGLMQQVETTRATIQTQIAERVATIQALFEEQRATLETALETAHSDVTTALETYKGEAEERGETAKTSMTQLYTDHQQTVEQTVQTHIQAVETIRSTNKSRASERIQQQAATARSKGEAKAGTFSGDERGQAQADAVREVAEEVAGEIESREGEVHGAIDSVVDDLPTQYEEQGQEVIQEFDKALPNMLIGIDDYVTNTVTNLENQAEQIHQLIDQFGTQFSTELTSMESATVTRIEGIGQEAEIQLDSLSLSIPEMIDTLAQAANEQIGQQVQQGVQILQSVEMPDVEAAQEMATQVEASANESVNDTVAQLQEINTQMLTQILGLETSTLESLDELEKQTTDQLMTMNETVETRLTDLVTKAEETFKEALEVLDESFIESEEKTETELTKVMDDLVKGFEESNTQADAEVQNAVNEGLAKNDEALGELDAQLQTVTVDSNSSSSVVRVQRQIDPKMEEAAKEAAWRYDHPVLATLSDIGSFFGGLIVGIVTVLAMVALVIGAIALLVALGVSGWVIAIAGLALLAYGIYQAYQARVANGEAGGWGTFGMSLLDMTGVTKIWKGITEPGLRPYERGKAIGGGLTELALTVIPAAKAARGFKFSSLRNPGKLLSGLKPGNLKNSLPNWLKNPKGAFSNLKTSLSKIASNPKLAWSNYKTNVGDRLSSQLPWLFHSEARATALNQIKNFFKGGRGSTDPQNAAQYAQYKEVLGVTEKANPLMESLGQTGELPNNFYTKQAASEYGWASGKAVDPKIPGGQIGGDIFKNSDGLLPSTPGRVWYEADAGLLGTMTRAKQPGTRLLYSSDGKAYVTYDHYGSFHPIEPWKDGVPASIWGTTARPNPDSENKEE